MGNQKTVTINQGSFDLTEGYGFKNWTAGDIGGVAFIYGGNSAYPPKGMQFNKSQSSYYLASTISAPGGITAVSVKIYEGQNERPWKLLTSNTPYDSVNGKPQNGTDNGTKTITTSGTTWYLDGTENYFALTYELTENKGVCYLSEITVSYYTDEGGGEINPPIEGNLVAFKNSISKIQSETKLSERYSAIKQSIALYKSLSDDDKAEVENEYLILLTEIDNYNSNIAVYNSDNQNTLYALLGGLSGFFGLVGAVLAVLVAVLR